MEAPRRPCVRCLVRDLPEGEALSAILRERVEALPPEARVSLAWREARLGACRACPHLNRGTCALCGCYVEVRAAKRGLDCPDVPARWPREAPPEAERAP